MGYGPARGGGAALRLPDRPGAVRCGRRRLS
jgi:hypothetical protein